MAHKTLVDGTVYEIDKGKTLVNGTGYAIDKGKTLVGGTAYDVGFTEFVIVNIARLAASTVNADAARVTINGVVYDGSETVELNVEVGTNIECYIVVSSTNAYISVNGEKVLTATGAYTYTLTKNCTIDLGKISNPFKTEGRIVITEE